MSEFRRRARKAAAPFSGALTYEANARLVCDAGLRLGRNPWARAAASSPA